MAEQAIVDLVEESLNLQLIFQEQYGGLNNIANWNLCDTTENSDQDHSLAGADPNDQIEVEQDPVEFYQRKSPHVEQVMEAHCEVKATRDDEADEEALDAIEDANVAYAIKLSMEDLDTKQPALTEEELAQKKASEEELHAKEQAQRQMETAQIKQDIAQFILMKECPEIEVEGINPVHQDQELNEKMIATTVQNAGNEQEPQAKEEEVPGTPPQKGQPKIVTPKEHKIERIEEYDEPEEEEQIDEIVATAQQEVSNLTTPTTMAGPT